MSIDKPEFEQTIMALHWAASKIEQENGPKALSLELRRCAGSLSDYAKPHKHKTKGEY